MIKAIITFLIMVFGICIWPVLMLELGSWIYEQDMHRLITFPILIFITALGFSLSAFCAFAPGWMYE